MRRADRGFTLLESVLVVCILAGILIGILTAVGVAVADTRRRQAIEQLQTLSDALHAFDFDVDDLPTAPAGPGTGLDELTASGRAGWRGPYIEHVSLVKTTPIPTTIRDYRIDPWGTAIQYTPPASIVVDGVTVTRVAVLRSLGPDNVASADDLVRTVAAQVNPVTGVLANRDRRVAHATEILARLNEATNAYQEYYTFLFQPGGTGANDNTIGNPGAGAPADNPAALRTQLRDNNVGSFPSGTAGLGYMQQTPIPGPPDNDEVDPWGQSYYLDGLKWYSRLLITGSEPQAAGVVFGVPRSKL